MNSKLARFYRTERGLVDEMTKSGNYLMRCNNFSQLPTPPGSDSAYSPDQQNGNSFISLSRKMRSAFFIHWTLDFNTEYYFPFLDSQKF